MKNIKLPFILIPLIGSLFFNSCKKYNDALPTVEVVSVTPFGNDSAILTGTVVSKGSDDIQYVGFSYSSVPNNNFTDNQILLNGTNGSFSYPVRLPQDSTYYIKCFAANSLGYGVSTAFKYSVPSATLDSASCALTANVINDNGSWTMAYVAYGPSYAPNGAYGIQASDVTTTENVTIQFKTAPLVNGLYTTEAGLPFYSDNNPFEVNIGVQVGLFTNYTINTGGTVYVTVYKSGTITVSFCSLTYTFSGHTYPFSGKILF